MASHTSSSASPIGRHAQADVSSIVDSIRAVVRDLRISGRESEQKLGVSGAQLYVLKELSESPALSIIDRLRAKGAEVRYHDPFVAEIDFHDAHTQSNDATPLQSVALTDDELRESDCVVIVTDHSDIDYRRVTDLAPVVVDTRNALSGDVRRASHARVIRL